MKYDIWIEGYCVTGMEGIPAKARCLATDVEENSFIEAVQKWYHLEPDAERRFGNLCINNNRATIWGCELFDNEQDARKSFG